MDDGRHGGVESRDAVEQSRGAPVVDIGCGLDAAARSRLVGAAPEPAGGIGIEPPPIGGGGVAYGRPHQPPKLS